MSTTLVPVTQAAASGGDAYLPVFGMDDDGDTLFYVIHGLALASLGISIIVSICVLTYLLKSGEKNVFKRPIGERLVVYLAVVDLFYSVSHSMDHIYMLAIRNHPPDGACVPFAFFLQFFIMVQALVVMLTAFNAFYMVVKEKKLDLGKNDWRLIVGVTLIPALIGIVGVAVPFLGPSGPWCFVDMRKSWGTAINNFYGMAMVGVFAWNMVFYGMVWFKINRASRTMAAHATDSQKKYHRLAKVMLMFVVVYLIQMRVHLSYAPVPLATYHDLHDLLTRFGRKGRNGRKDRNRK